MDNASKKRELPLDLQEEGQALEAAIKAFNQEKKPGEKISAAKAAESLGMTTTGFHHYLKGKNPLNLNVAMKVSKIYGFPVSSFSPRLAEEMLVLAELAGLEQVGDIPAGVKRAWDRMNEKLLLLSHTPIPALPGLVEEIERERLAIQKAIQGSLLKA